MLFKFIKCYIITFHIVKMKGSEIFMLTSDELKLIATFRNLTPENKENLLKAVSSDCFPERPHNQEFLAFPAPFVVDKA